MKEEIEEAHFIFPYSFSMKAFIFGNFEDKRAFRVIGDDDIIEVSGSSYTASNLNRF